MKISEVWNNVKEFVKKHKQTLLWGAAVGVLVVVVVYSFINEKKKSPDDQFLIDVPLSVNQNNTVDIPDNVVKNRGKVADKLPIYEILKEDKNITVAGFVKSFAGNNYRKQGSDDVVYVWTYKDGAITYNSYTDILDFNLSDAISPKTISLESNSEESYKKYFQDFIKNYIDAQLKFTNIKVTQEGKYVRVTANRDMDGYPLYYSRVEDYTDYLYMKSTGEIIQGEILLTKFNKNDVNAKIVKPSDLKKYISLPSYPKDFNQDFSSDLSIPVSNSPLNTDSSYDNFGFDPSTNGSGDQYKAILATKCTASDMTLGYIYSNNTYVYSMPVYQLNCIGKVTKDKKQYDVEIRVLANAIDPSLVYSPDTGK